MEIKSIKDAAKMLGVSRTTIWQLGKDSSFPKLITISPGRKGFVASELEAFVESRIAARDQERAA
ncbi:helix-turn-helix transcriptional regulator [Aurantimonas endophytica]|uniref:Putative DNA-binding transcriptional regulator AlpA n=1 Tax=Aurantimonas endophytica TaxID=1522175 RepID=A0A7W6MPQ0_9HYPH|nr:AlpA family phage regulatory protein [Aurantimonas endophytica]MBB4003168.1 putative DNA-binding transcriptional regulator AlpA [Aurantimonas endophytica]MCO6404039.1 AlpA family phage regulatory protein [Aurantimonas endophytica]